MDRFNEGVIRSRTRRLSVGLARDAGEVREAQRLRWQVFAGELGAKLQSAEPGIDHDIFDPYCEHLVVRDGDQVVGTYRLLPPEGAKRIGLYYSETEFDLIRLRGIRHRMVEVGRSCIAPGYRTGGVISLLWSGLARYVLSNGHGYLAGCASISLADGGRTAAALAQREEHLAPMEYRTTPRRKVLLKKESPGGKVQLPPLVKGYLRAGAWICGEPALDTEFNCADFFVLLPLERIESRYARHFFGPG
jgi:putative hemolysin